MWPEIWSSVSTAAQRKEKQQWAIEKPKLDNARTLRGIFFIDPDDESSRKPLKTQGKVGTSNGSRYASQAEDVLARGRKPGAKPTKSENQSMHALEKLTSLREECLEGFLLKDLEDHIVEKEGFNSLSHFILVRKFVLMPQAMKILDAKAAVDKEWEKLEKLPAWQMTKVKSKKEVILETQTEQRTVHFATLMDICHLKDAELEPKLKKKNILRLVCAPR